MNHPAGAPHPYTYLREFFSPSLVAQLWDYYFKKEFPHINPISLPKETWHPEANTIVDWHKAVRKELKIIEHHTGQEPSVEWGTCDWGAHYGPLWDRDACDLCINCREAFDRGERKVIDLDMMRAVKAWTTYLNANNTETIRPEVDTP